MRCYVWPLLCLSSHLPNTQGFAGNHCYGRKVKEKTAHARVIHWIMVDSLVPEGYCGLGCWKEAKCSEPSFVDLVCIVMPFWLVGSKSWQVGFKMCCFHSLFHDCLWVANRSQACLMSNDSIYHFLYPNALFYDCLSLFWYAGNMWMSVRGKSTLCMYTFSKNCWMFFFILYSPSKMSSRCISMSNL